MYETPECIVDQATVELDPEYRAALVLPPLKFNSGLAKIICISLHDCMGKSTFSDCGKISRTT